MILAATTLAIPPNLFRYVWRTSRNRLRSSETSGLILRALGTLRLEAAKGRGSKQLTIGSNRYRTDSAVCIRVSTTLAIVLLDADSGGAGAGGVSVIPANALVANVSANTNAMLSR